MEGSLEGQKFFPYVLKDSRVVYEYFLQDFVQITSSKLAGKRLNKYSNQRGLFYYIKPYIYCKI